MLAVVSGSAVNKLITHGTTPAALPCWAGASIYNKTRDTRLRKLVNTRNSHVLHSHQSSSHVVRERAFLLAGAGGCALRKKILVFRSSPASLFYATAMSAQP